MYSYKNVWFFEGFFSIDKTVKSIPILCSEVKVYLTKHKVTKFGNEKNLSWTISNENSFGSFQCFRGYVKNTHLDPLLTL